RSLEPKGVLVRSIYQGSAAEQAGLRPTQARQTRRGFNTQFYIVYGDLIVQADGNRIESLDNWYSFLESKKPGDQVTLTIIRGLDTRSAEQLDVQIMLEEDNYR
ncbi:MAG: PDZ domain-containing protein, partial [Planctomycetales bacterium]|nr:PDZ domain-containing protein [Planctomycetales bacterium]